MAHKITACVDKNANWKVVTILNAAGDIQSDISVNRTNKKGETFPNFDEIKVGATIQGQLWQSPAGKHYLFPPKGSAQAPAPKADMGPAANNAATAELKNMINLGVRPQLTELKAILFAIAAHLEVKIPDSRGYDYPEINETNNSNGLDFENDGPITRSDTPF